MYNVLVAEPFFVVQYELFLYLIELWNEQFIPSKDV